MTCCDRESVKQSCQAVATSHATVAAARRSTFCIPYLGRCYMDSRVSATEYLQTVSVQGSAVGIYSRAGQGRACLAIHAMDSIPWQTAAQEIAGTCSVPYVPQHPSHPIPSHPIRYLLQSLGQGLATATDDRARDPLQSSTEHAREVRFNGLSAGVALRSVVVACYLGVLQV